MAIVEKNNQVERSINVFDLSAAEEESVQQLSIDTCLKIAQQGIDWVKSKELVCDSIKRKPWQLLRPIEEASTALSLVHFNPKLNGRLLAASSKNPLAGKLYIELAKGAAYILRASVPLFRGESKSQNFIEKANEHLSDASGSLLTIETPENKVRGLAALVESDLMKADNFASAQWSDQVRQDLISLSEQFGGDYPEVVARAASQVIAWQSKRGAGKVYDLASYILRSLSKVDPYVCQSMLVEETRSVKNRNTRSKYAFLVLPIASLINSNFNNRKQALNEVLNLL